MTAALFTPNAAAVIPVTAALLIPNSNVVAP